MRYFKTLLLPINMLVVALIAGRVSNSSKKSMSALGFESDFDLDVFMLSNDSEFQFSVQIAPFLLNLQH